MEPTKKMKPTLTDKEYSIVCRVIERAGGDTSIEIPESDEEVTEALKKLMDTAKVPKLV